VGTYFAKQAYDCVLLNNSRYAQASLGMLADGTIAIPVIHNNEDVVYRIAFANPKAWNAAVAVSPKTFQIASTRLPGKVVKTILHGVPSPTEEMFDNRDRLTTPVRLLFVGRIHHKHKGVLYLPEILRACLDHGIELRLTVIGEGHDMAKLRMKLKTAGVLDAVIFKGTIAPESIYGEMLKHHILLMPSHFEGFPIVPLEAQACGCVPIVSYLPSITDFTVINGTTGLLVDVGDIDGFARCVEKLVKDPMLWCSFSSSGHDRIKHEFSISGMGEAYMRVIRGAIDGRYPLRTPRSHIPRIDMSLFTWRDRVPAVAISASEGLGQMWRRTFARTGNSEPRV
jgi:glycosyltransferase involved in cell wall biosynthesis